MDALYRAADLFVLCSLKEMMPIALLEASASGLPTLVNHHPVLQWMVGPGGLGIDMAGAGTLAAEIGRLVGEPSERRRLGEAARRHCVDAFGTDQVLAQILNYYRFVLGEPNA
jgi:glycosyltransferase involved in cell wall biosynthesis